MNGRFHRTLGRGAAWTLVALWTPAVAAQTPVPAEPLPAPPQAQPAPQAQPTASTPAPDEPPSTPFVGGLGKAYIGGIGLDVGDVESSLRPLVGTDASIGQLGMQLGGGGFALIGGVVLAGGGYAIFTPTSNGQRGDVSLTGGGGGLALGYAVVNDRDWIVYPYFGLGGYGYTLDLSNVSGVDLPLGGGEVLRPGQSASYDAGFLTADMGISANRLLFFGHDGGFALGLDAGFLTSVTGSKWERQDGGAVAEALERALLRGAYMRLTVGGGGFFFDD